ncbi:hypothetical protein ES705_31723 [subsurface metagenome]
MRLKIITLFFTSLLFVSSCDILNLDEDGLTTEDIVEGLKKALEIGADSASGTLSLLNGYYHGHEVFVKIPLPEEASNIRNSINGNSTLRGISDLIGLEDAFGKVILAVNRAAEDAAKDAAPIFKDAISALTIGQGWDILNGTVPGAGNGNTEFDSTAATEFLRIQTYDPLTDVYAPKINLSLNKDLIGNISAYDAWNDLTSLYNSFVTRADVMTAIELANILGGNINLPGAIETDIGVFSTQKALNGLFYMVGEEEKKIRKDPFQWGIDIIEKVFGSIL